jgi:hypothetical protein
MRAGNEKDSAHVLEEYLNFYIPKLNIMKIANLLPLLLLPVASLSVAAQSSKKASALVSAWSEQTDSAYEIKLISPTHVFFYVKSMVNDSAFATGAGTYTLSGNQYTENLQYASFDVKGIKATYDYSVQGNKMKQQGTLVLADGTKIPINHTFTRIEDVKQNPGKHVGTWNQLSSTYNTGNDSGSHTNATHIRYQIITPTHWLRISMANGAFENAFGGTYTANGDKVTMKVDFASFPITGATVELTQRFENNRMFVKGTGKDAQGKQLVEFEDVFERVDAKQ